MMTMRTLLIAVVVLMMMGKTGAVGATLVHEEVERATTETYPPAGWEAQAFPDPSSSVELTFVLWGPQGEASDAELYEVLHAVSTPGSPKYGAHLGREEVRAAFGAPDAAVQVLESVLEEYGIGGGHVSARRGFYSVSATVEQAEALLGGAVYGTFVHSVSGVRATRLVDPVLALPTRLKGIVRTLGPGLRFPALHSFGSMGVSFTGEQLVTPAFLRALYKVSGSNHAASNSVAVAAFLGQNFAPSDLQTFFKALSPSDLGREPEVHGPNDASRPTGESSLDIQYVMSLASNVTTQYWYTPGTQPGNKENEPFLAWLADVDDQASPAKIFSVSYGDDEGGVVQSYADAVNTAFAKLGVQGVTVLTGSGDGGVEGAKHGPCTVFNPTFPASSPYVTAVGATQGSAPEVAASFSGGGFSNYWPRLSFQDAAVSAYLSSSHVPLPAKNLYNEHGAGFPDIAAQGVNFEIYVGGKSLRDGGTSCSTPTAAGILALVNGLRIEAGKPPLGWLNPALYTSLHTAFTDITSGNNPGCSTQGFYAAPGWDPVTGWGTIDFELLSKAAIALE